MTSCWEYDLRFFVWIIISLGLWLSINLYISSNTSQFIETISCKWLIPVLKSMTDKPIEITDLPWRVFSSSIKIDNKLLESSLSLLLISKNISRLDLVKILVTSLFSYSPLLFLGPIWSIITTV